MPPETKSLSAIHSGGSKKETLDLEPNITKGIYLQDSPKEEEDEEDEPQKKERKRSSPPEEPTVHPKRKKTYNFSFVD